jgi:hypothetical protein
MPHYLPRTSRTRTNAQLRYSQSVIYAQTGKRGPKRLAFSEPGHIPTPLLLRTNGVEPHCFCTVSFKYSLRLRVTRSLQKHHLRQSMNEYARNRRL